MGRTFPIGEGKLEMRTRADLAVPVVLLAAMASAGSTGWIEDSDGFKDEYAYDSHVLPAPWGNAVSMVAHRGIGYKGTAGVRGPDGDWGHAYCATSTSFPAGDLNAANHATLSVDSYHYYGTDDLYLGYIHRFLKRRGQFGILVPGLTRELPATGVPAHLKSFWDPKRPRDEKRRFSGIPGDSGLSFG